MIWLGGLALLGLVLFNIWFFTRMVDTLRNGLAPAIATPADALGQIYKALQLKPNSYMLELGCGDGRILAYCAGKQPKAKFVGVENGVLQFIKAKWNTRNVKNVKLIFGDFRKANLKGVSHMYLYLLPEALALVEPRVQQGTRVVSCQYPLSKRPSQAVRLRPEHRLAQKLYIYSF